MKAQGVPVEFAVLDEGTIALTSVLHIVKKTKVFDLASALIEAALSPAAQSSLMQDPFLMVPSNTKVELSGPVADLLVKDPALPNRFVVQDWAEINKHRADWITRFDRDMQG